MNDKTTVAARPNTAHRRSPIRRIRDLEDQADEFEEELAAELIRKGVIERW